MKDRASNPIPDAYAPFVETPRCAHQETECNNCPLMPLPYGKQLEFKKEKLKALFGQDIDLRPADAPFGYRNKFDFAFIEGVLGYRKKIDFTESFAIKRCELANENVNRLIPALAEKLNGMPFAAIMQREPGLGYVTVRTNRAQDVLVNFVFFGKTDEKIEAVAKELMDGFPFAKSANILLNETWSDTACGKILQTFGQKSIEEEMCGKKFRIYANTFFQTNVASAEGIFRLVKEEVPEGARVLDLYSGAGVISLIVAEKAARVKGVESAAESVAGADENKGLNGIANAEFLAERVEKALNDVNEGDFDCAILDPPREGLTPKAARRLIERKIPKIIYVSCKPESLARDLIAFKKADYGIKSIQAFDQFPHTLHMEMLCVMEKNQGLIRE